MAVSLAHGAHLAEQDLRMRRRTAPARARTFLSEQGRVSTELIDKYRRRGQSAGGFAGAILGNSIAYGALETAQIRTGRPYLQPRFQRPARMTGTAIGYTAGRRWGGKAGARYGRWKQKRRLRQVVPREFPTGQHLVYTSKATIPKPRVMEVSPDNIAGAAVDLSQELSPKLARQERRRLRQVGSTPKKTLRYRLARFGVSAAGRTAGVAAGATAGQLVAPGPVGAIGGGIAGGLAGTVVGRSTYTPRVHKYMAKDWKKTKTNYRRRQSRYRRFKSRHNLGRGVWEQDMAPVKYNPKVTTAAKPPMSVQRPMTVMSPQEKVNPQARRVLPSMNRQARAAKSRRNIAQRTATRQGRGNALRREEILAEVAKDLKTRSKDASKAAARVPLRVIDKRATKHVAGTERLMNMMGVSKMQKVGDAIGRGLADEKSSPKKEIQRLIKQRKKRIQRERAAKGYLESIEENIALKRVIGFGRRVAKNAPLDDTRDSSPKKKLTRLEKLPKPTRRYNRMGKKLKSSISSSDRYAHLSKREKDRIKFGVMRKQGWKPKRERKYQVTVGG